MARSLNKAQIIGNLGADPEHTVTGTGKSVANFRVATTETYKNAAGEFVEETEWHTVTAWGKLADIVNSYLKKGSQVFVEGKNRTDTWENDDGETQYKRYIQAREVLFLGGIKEGPSSNATSDAYKQPVEEEEEFDLF